MREEDLEILLQDIGTRVREGAKELQDDLDRAWAACDREKWLLHDSERRFRQQGKRLQGVRELLDKNEMGQLTDADTLAKIRGLLHG